MSDDAALGVIEPGVLELGVIEGFYGAPWSHTARSDLLRFAASVGVRTYVWAPKNHPAHRQRWSEDATGDHLAEMAELAGLARELGVRWVYGLSPVLRLGRASVDAKRVVARLEPLRVAGVRSFLVGFDDTWPTLLPRFATREVGRAHGEVARTALEELRSRSPDVELRIVPAIYAGRLHELPTGAVDYLRGLGERAAGIPAAWTGPRIFSPWIRGSDRAALEAATGLSLWVWNNAIANDWLPLISGAPLGRTGLQRLSAGPAVNMDADLPTGGALIALNGACEAELTKPALHALAAWARSPATFDPGRALEAGLFATFGEGGAAALGRLLDATSRHALAAPWRRDLGSLDAAVARFAASLALEEGAPEAVAAAEDLQRELSALAELPSRVERAFGGSAVALDVAPTARKLALLARAGLAAVEATGAPTRGARRGSRAEVARLLREARRIPWSVDESAFRRLAELGVRHGPARRRDR